MKFASAFAILTGLVSLAIFPSSVEGGLTFEDRCKPFGINFCSLFESSEDESSEEDGDRRLLSLEESTALMVDGECASDLYEVSLFVNSHIFLMAEPLKKDEEKDCPILTFDFEFLDDAGEKTVHVLNDIVEDLAAVQPRLILATRELSKIASALTEAKPTRFGEGMQKDYDLWTNNCASFVLNMMAKLDIPADERVATFTAEQLIKSENFRTVVKENTPEESSALRSPYEAIVDKLVRSYIKDEFLDM